MKSFQEFIGESTEESRHPYFDRLLKMVPEPRELIEYFKDSLGDDWHEIDVNSPIGEKLVPGYFENSYRYRGVCFGKSCMYYYTPIGSPKEVIALRKADDATISNATTWWVRQSEIDRVDSSWLINNIFRDF